MKNTSLSREPNPAQVSEPQVAELASKPAVTRQVVLGTAQQQALEWLFGGGSITEAAQFAGVTRQTISRWLREDLDFLEVYNAWQQEAASSLHGRMIALSEVAMDNIANAIRTKPACGHQNSSSNG